jgi:hypothetical protein
MCDLSQPEAGLSSRRGTLDHSLRWIENPAGFQARQPEKRDIPIPFCWKVGHASIDAPAPMKMGDPLLILGDLCVLGGFLLITAPPRLQEHQGHQTWHFHESCSCSGAAPLMMKLRIADCRLKNENVVLTIRNRQSAISREARR